LRNLIREARARGIHVGVVLRDRAFFTVDVIATLKRLGVYFIIPAVKNDKVKEAIRNYDEKQPAKRFVLGEKKKNVALNLPLCKRSAESVAEKEEADHF
jgi:GTP-binding protein EngB required for normal cell division